MFNIQNYTEEVYEKIFPFKGYKRIKVGNKLGDERNPYQLTYKSIYFRSTNPPVFSDIGVQRMIEGTVWRYQRLPGLELCYRLSYSLDVIKGYMVQPARDFRLMPMKDYPWLNTTQQKYKYPKGPLNNLICVKHCPVGLYYDFDSLSCRQCGIGCARCHRYGECDECIPGYSLVQTPKLRRLKRSQVEKTCVVGCQEGFYRKRFNGKCLECPKGCKLCRDRSVEELAMISVLDKKDLGSEGFCVICEKNDTNLNVIADSVSGKCIQSCGGEGKVLVKKNSSLFNLKHGLKYQVCETCKFSECVRCPEANLRSCIRCRKGFFLEKNPKRNVVCLRFSELKNYRLHVMTEVAVCLMALTTVVLCITKLVVILKKKIMPKTKKTQKSKDSHSVAIIDPDHFPQDEEAENPDKVGTPFERIKKMSTLKTYQRRIFVGNRQKLKIKDEKVQNKEFAQKKAREKQTSPRTFSQFEKKIDIAVQSKNSDPLLLKWIERVKELELVVQRLEENGNTCVSDSKMG